MKNNTGEAIVIVGSIYLLTIIEGWVKWLMLIPLMFAFFTWSKHAVVDEQKELVKTSLIKLKLEIELMKAQTAFYIAQGAQIMRRMKASQ